MLQGFEIIYRAMNKGSITHCSHADLKTFVVFGAPKMGIWDISLNRAINPKTQNFVF